MHFTHNTPPPPPNSNALPLIGSPLFHWQSVHVWLMYAVKLLATMPLTSPPPPQLAHPSLRPCCRPPSNKFVSVHLWNIDCGRVGDGEWKFGLRTDQKVGLVYEGNAKCEQDGCDLWLEASWNSNKDTNTPFPRKWFELNHFRCGSSTGVKVTLYWET